MEPVFVDKSFQPDDDMLKDVLGKSYKYFDQFRKSLHKEYEGLREEWKYYGPKYGWSLKCFRKNRNLFFFTPYKNSVHVAFLFSEKAVKTIQECNFRKEMIDELNNSKKYVEGRPLRIEVDSVSKVKDLLRLITIKINN